MGWYITLLKNDLVINQGVRDAIDALPHYHDFRYGWINSTCIFHDGDKLVFVRWAKEWMDYMHFPEVKKMLRDNKVNGEVLFTSYDGDNKGKFWGYRYVDGELTELTVKGDEWVAKVTA